VNFELFLARRMHYRPKRGLVKQSWWAGFRALLPGSMANLASQAMLVVLGLFTGIVTARVLGPKDRGELSFLVLVPMILTVVGSLGMENGIYYFWHHGEGRFQSHLLGACAVVTLASGSFFGLLSYAAISWLRPQTALLLRLLVAASIPLVVANAMLTMALLASGRIGRYNASRLAGPIFYTCTIAALWVFGRLGVSSAFLAWFGSMVVTVIADLTLMIGLVGRKPQWDARMTRRSLSYGLRSWVGNVSQYGTLRLDQVMLGALAGNGPLGFYYATVSVGETLLYVATNTGTAMMAQFGRRSITERRQLALLTMVATATLTAVAVIVLALWGGSAINLLFGKSYLPALSSLRILLIGMIPLALAQIMSGYFIAIGRAQVFAHAALASLGVTVIADIVLIPHFRADGAAMASVLAYMVMALWMAARFRSHRDIYSGRHEIDPYEDSVTA
jgi:O-antigen/teichoic acid export membrane protein